MIIDGWIVPEDLSIIFAEGKQNPVDVIVGSNKDEHLAMGGRVAFRDTLMWAMRLFAERQTAIGQHAYWYFFTHEPPVEPGVKNLKATHAAEIPYVFETLSAPRSIPDLSSPRLAAASEPDRALADEISSYWVNFAKTGDPNGKGLPAWAAFKRRRPAAYFGRGQRISRPRCLEPVRRAIQDDAVQADRNAGYEVSLILSGADALVCTGPLVRSCSGRRHYFGYGIFTSRSPWNAPR